nr:ribonuclease H-like domain-containing protein [Tanacetum cinerariifolium]
MQVSKTQKKQGRKELKHMCFFLCYLMSVSPDIHSSSCGDLTREQGDKAENKDKGKSHVVTITGFRDLNEEFAECINNSSNRVNAAGSSIFAAGLNFTNSINDFSTAGPSNATMPNLEDLPHNADDAGAEADINNMESIISVSPIPTSRIHKDHLTSQIISDLSSTTQTRSMARGVRDQDLPYGKRAIDTKWVYRNKKDERGIVIKNKARLVAQGHTQEEGIDYEEVSAQDDVVQEHVIEEIATKVVPPTSTSPSPPSPVIPSSPPHQSPCPPQPPQPQAAEGSSQLIQQVLDKCSALVLRVEGLKNANAAQQLEIIKLKARVKKLERLNKVKSSKLRRLKKVGTSQLIESLDDVENVFNQERISVDIDKGVELVVDQEKDDEIEGRHADTQAKIYNIDLDHSSKVLSMQEDTEVQEAVEVVTTAKLITEVVTGAATQVAAASTPIPAAKPVAKPKVLKIVAAPAVSIRRIKGVVIRDPEEELHVDTPAETPTLKDKGKGILIEDPKPMKKKDQIEMDAEYGNKLQEE